MNKPMISVVVVNKRINQRFFMIEPKTGKILNPPSGCIIDKELTANPSDVGENEFDFFISSVKQDRGCVLPVHYYCWKNDTKLTKLDL